MVEKKTAGKGKKVRIETIPKESGEENVGPRVKKSEESQLRWFLFLVFILFGSFLVPYLYMQSLSKFEYAGVDWRIEEYGDLTVYHSQFPAFDNLDLIYNLFLRGDPRENEVIVESGSYDEFYSAGYISFDNRSALCLGELPRSMVDLAQFLIYAVGLDPNLQVSTTDLGRHNETGEPYAVCSNTFHSTLVIVEMGGISKIRQDEENEACYIITINDCNDIAPIEKFMTHVVSLHYGENS